PAHDGPLKVVQVCSARNSTYGAVASMMTLCHELVLRGHAVSFATFKGRGLGAHVKSLGYPDTEFPVRFKVDPIAVVQIARWMRREQFDIVHCHLSTSSTNGSLAAKLARVPSVATVHGLSGKMSFVAADHLIAVSGEVRRHLVTQGMSEAKISVVHNGIPVGHKPTEEERAGARAALRLPLDVPIFGTTARLTPLKGIDQALHAARRVVDDVPRAMFVVFGDGASKAEYVEMARSLGLSDNVLFAGYRSDVRDLLPALDVFVFPTLKEAMGIALVEAMAAGVPVVANDVGGVPEVVREGTGFLVTPGEAVSMADR
ncbi:MAG: glycosyltransferase family 4 protein, partial [Armatimonadetes bacterium]|nr:glycosyltransferase family 4 protein [Armatimonadota bacterium]